jgi:dienelactone hydrolase
MRYAYAAFDSLADPPLRLAGKLAISDSSTPENLGPAVLICHGSDGVDGRGEFYAGELQAAGIATFEVDMWTARGTARGAAARPRSPFETLPDAYGALEFLAAQPEIDGARVGIMGFSWGGVVTLLSAIGRHAPKRPFKAHAAMYPVCWVYRRNPEMALTGLTGAPVLIQTGSADAYDDPDAGEQLLASLAPDDARHVRHIVHPGAGHGYDRDRPAQTIVDPAAHNGAGGPVLMAFHPQAAARSRDAVTAFFRDAL